MWGGGNSRVYVDTSRLFLIRKKLDSGTSLYRDTAI
jgi:hypothetical protein